MGCWRRGMNPISGRSPDFRKHVHAYGQYLSGYACRSFERYSYRNFRFCESQHFGQPHGGRDARLQYGSHAALTSNDFGGWIVHLRDYHHFDERFQRQREPLLQHDCSPCDPSTFLLVQPEFCGERFRNCNPYALHYGAARSFRHVRLIAATARIRLGGGQRRAARGCIAARCSFAPASPRGRTRPHATRIFHSWSGLRRHQQQRWRREDRRNASRQLHDHSDGDQQFAAAVTHRQRGRHGAGELRRLLSGLPASSRLRYADHLEQRGSIVAKHSFGPYVTDRERSTWFDS